MSMTSNTYLQRKFDRIGIGEISLFSHIFKVIGLSLDGNEAESVAENLVLEDGAHLWSQYLHNRGVVVHKASLNSHGGNVRNENTTNHVGQGGRDTSDLKHNHSVLLRKSANHPLFTKKFQ